MPEISIIIPFYKVENYIKKCIESVKIQSFTDYECILINDGSPDNSYKIAEQTIVGDNRFYIIHQENKGLGGARNTGIEHAKGKYIVFLDSDDYWEKNFLEIMHKNAMETGADIVRCAYRYVTETGVSLPQNWKIPQGIFTCKERFLQIMLYHHIAWNKLYKREIFKNIRFPEKIFFEDWSTIYKTAFYSDKIVFIKDILYNYLQRKGSIMHTFNEKKINDRIINFKNIERYLENKTPNSSPPLFSHQNLFLSSGRICLSKCYGTKNRKTKKERIIKQFHKESG